MSFQRFGKGSLIILKRTWPRSVWEKKKSIRCHVTCLLTIWIIPDKELVGQLFPIVAWIPSLVTPLGMRVCWLLRTCPLQSPQMLAVQAYLLLCLQKLTPADSTLRLPAELERRGERWDSSALLLLCLSTASSAEAVTPQTCSSHGGLSSIALASPGLV